MNMLKSIIALLVLLLFTTISPAAETPSDVTYLPDVTFTLRTGIAEGKMVFIGATGDIKGVINPTLKVPSGAVVQINLINGDGAVHDIALPDFNVKSDQIVGMNASTTVVFRASKDGKFYYFCSLPGHRAAGMEGLLLVGDAKVEDDETPKDPIALDPGLTGERVGDRPPKHVEVNLETIERVAQLTDGVTYRYWTFNDHVPGPFIRIRVGDTVTVNVHNRPDSMMIHSVDMHAVTGPGGGAIATQVPPGETRSFTFKALHPGLFVYHCATPMVAQHIANGMYGLILVVPEGGLPKVDKEFYVMQGEIYTTEPYHSHGMNEFSLSNMLDEEPTYYVFNGAEGSLTETHRMQAQVGDTVRIYFGVGGPNATSSFHVIGEVFDRVYHEGSLVSPSARSVQTTTVSPGGATMVEFRVDYPGRYILVDHALARAERGLVGILHVDGPADPDIFKPHDGMSNAGH